MVGDKYDLQVITRIARRNTGKLSAGLNLLLVKKSLCGPWAGFIGLYATREPTSSSSVVSHGVQEERNPSDRILGWYGVVHT